MQGSQPLYCILFLSFTCAGIRFHYVRFFLFFFACLLYLAEVLYYDHFTDEKIGVNLAEDCGFDAATSEYPNGSFWPCLELQ